MFRVRNGERVSTSVMKNRSTVGGEELHRLHRRTGPGAITAKQICARDSLDLDRLRFELTGPAHESTSQHGNEGGFPCFRRVDADGMGISVVAFKFRV